MTHYDSPHKNPKRETDDRKGKEGEIVLSSNLPPFIQPVSPQFRRRRRRGDLSTLPSFPPQKKGTNGFETEKTMGPSCHSAILPAAARFLLFFADVMPAFLFSFISHRGVQSQFGPNVSSSSDLLRR